jgi:hypothetical protein
MKNSIKAALYTAGALTAAFVTLTIGNLICKKKEKQKDDRPRT